MVEKKKAGVKPPTVSSQHVALVGLTLKDGTRIEPGDLFPGSPPAWLIEQGKVT